MGLKVSASMVLYKTPPTVVERAIDCVLNSGVQNLWIVDHSPTDELKHFVKKDPRIVYLHSENKGYGAGNNRGMRESIRKGYKYHLVMNPDIYWEGDVIARLVDYLDNNDDVALVMPNVLFPDGTFQLQAKYLPSATDMLLNRLGFRKKKYKAASRYLQTTKVPVEMPFLSGCFMLMRNDALKETGLFDERFFMYCEDMDLSRRLNEKFRTMYFPGAHIYHDYGRASRHNIIMFMHHAMSALKYFNKWKKNKA